MLRRLGILIIALSVSLSRAPGALAQDSSDSSEYLIKAGFIFNFAKFVEWPPTTFAQPDSPIVIGILRSEEHTSELQSHSDLVCRLLLEKKKKKKNNFLILLHKPRTQII